MKSFPLEALASLGVPPGAGVGFQLLSVLPPLTP